MKQKVYLIRHGETEWTLAQKHTGLTDIPLTDHGRQQGLWLKEKLAQKPFAKVFCSPLKRAAETCAIAGFQKVAEIDRDLVEWNYGDYEGKTSAEIHKLDPNWTIFSQGGPHGESVTDIQARAGRILGKIRTIKGDVALFSSGHFLRALTACWLGYPISEGKSFLLSIASLSILGYEREMPVIITWNVRQT